MKKILTAVSLMILGISSVYATGTTAGTSIENSVTLNYTVGTVAQTAITSNTDTFVVDKKIDFTLANNDGNQVVAVPGSTNNVTNWTLTNTGNANQYFTLASTDLSGQTIYGDADTANTTAQNIQYSTDGGGTWTSYSGPISIAKDANILVRVRSDIALSATNGQVMNIQLLATATTSGGVAETATDGADTQASVDTVLADGAGDADAQYSGTMTAWGGYLVQTATIAVTKSSCAVSDPVNGTTNPKRIPGATMRYAVEVANTGSASALSVSVADTLNGALTYSNGLISAGACNCASPGTSNGDTVSAAGQNVTADFGTVAVGATECAYINVLIN
jgi:hypothetical protein